jgi:hypothetical protein
MKRYVSALLKGLAIFIMLFNISCTECDQENNTVKVEDGRFFFVYVDDASNYSHFSILVDKETRIQYLVFSRMGNSTSGIAMTPLLDRDGNITYYQGELTGRRLPY